MDNIKNTLNQLTEETHDIKVNGKTKLGVHPNYLRVLDKNGVKYEIIKTTKYKKDAESWSCRRCGKRNTEQNHCGCYD